MQRLAMLSVGALALTAGAFFTPHAPPLYDGIGFPDEPYRYAQVLANDPVKTPPPTTATATLTISGGSNGRGVYLTSGESGPQLTAFVPQGAVQAGAPTLAIRASPLAPDEPAPADGPVAGDIYRLAASGAATWHAGSNGTISLRSPQGIPVTPIMEFRSEKQTWRQLPTTRVGTDIWEAPLGNLGDYALILPAHPRAATNPGSNHTLRYVVPAVVGLLALALLGTRLALRRRVSDGPADDEPSDRGQDT